MDQPHPNLFTALLAAQAAIGPITKDNTATVPSAKGQGYQYHYADLGSVMEAIKGPLLANQLVVYQPLSMTPDGQPTVRTVIAHAPTGEKIESEAPLVCRDPQNPQAVGGAITYFRRYSLLSMLGLAPEDDDGQAASKPAAPRQQQSNGVQNGNGPAIHSWIVLWNWAKENDLPTTDKASAERFLGYSITGKTPADIQTALLERMTPDDGE